MSDTKIKAIDVRRSASRDKAAVIRRQIMIKENSRLAPKLVSNTLSICKQGENYFIDNVEIWISSTQRNLDQHQVIALKYEQYLEALKSLIHNINFVLAAQNFGIADKKGKIIDIEHIKSKNFTYSTNIRSIYGTSSKRRSFIAKERLNEQLIKTLESSQHIIESIEKELKSILLEISDLEIASKLAITQETKKQILDVARNLNIGLQNNKINLDTFANAICFEKKKESLFNNSL